MLFFILLGCDTNQMAQAWQIDRLRVLAIAAEPAEPRPGDLVTFTSLTVSPGVPVAMATWFVCLITEEEDFGCSADSAALEGLVELDPETMSPEELEALYLDLMAAGLIGVEPFLPPVWSVPVDALDSLAEEDRLEGTIATITVSAIPEGDEVAEGDVEIVYKRVPVSLATTPNRNPGLTGLLVDGVAIPSGSRLTVDHGQTYEIELVLAGDAVESYAYTNQSGEVETRIEEPYFNWYLQEGTFDQENTLYPYVSVQYTAPASPALVEQSLWVVARDRRGGMSWLELPILVK